jgi:hypothetical protein
MAYGLRYTITQELRDGTSLIVKIYEKSYVAGIVTPYIGTNVSLVPNSANEDPIAIIISSQLNVSFIISDQEDYDNFPDLLNFDETKYYVELVINAQIKWRGFLLNDYIQVPFTTGNQEVSINCIDGLSFLRYIYYDGDVNVNSLIKQIDIIGTSLNQLPFDDTIFIYDCCSYYADGMFDRGDAGGDEPFSQTYQYNRDFYKLDYYTILENIIKSFGCRLFQANGDWYILPMNQQADTIYYTRYVVDNVPSVSGNGTLTNTINIQPYQEGNVHFVNNNQTKIVRKGYPTIQSTLPYDYAANYIYNGTFKFTTGSGASLRANGWDEFEQSPSRATLVVLPEDQSNRYEIFYLGGSTIAYIQNYFAAPTLYEYLPKMYGTSASLSFEYQASSAGDRIRLFITAFIGGVTYYLRDDDIWTTTVSFRDIIYTTFNTYVSYNVDIPMGYSQALSLVIEGLIGVRFSVGNGAVGGYIKNVKLTQGDASIKEVVLTRNIGSTSQIATDIDIPYSAIYPPQGASPIRNNVGLLFKSDGDIWTDWYRYGYPPEAFTMLAELVMRQYSNLLNKNIATLEGDLGAIAGANGFIYLDKTYTIQDASTNALSYNNKKFLINRLTSNPYMDETSQIQLLEITMVDNASTATVDYIGDVTIETPKRYFNNA